MRKHTMKKYQHPQHLNAVDHCLKQAKLVFTAPTLTSSHTVSLTRGGLTVRWTHKEGACWSSVCRLCSAHWTGRENMHSPHLLLSTYSIIHFMVYIHIALFGVLALYPHEGLALLVQCHCA